MYCIFASFCFAQCSNGLHLLLHISTLAGCCHCSGQRLAQSMSFSVYTLCWLMPLLMPLLMPFRHFAALCRQPLLLRGSQVASFVECIWMQRWMCCIMLHAVPGDQCCSSVGQPLQKALQRKLAAGLWCSQNSLACLGCIGCLGTHKRKVQRTSFF